MQNYNKMWVAVIGLLVTGFESGGWLIDLLPDLPVYLVPTLTAILVALIPNGRPFWEVTQPSQ